jgi:hypothetical protein
MTAFPFAGSRSIRRGPSSSATIICEWILSPSRHVASVSLLKEVLPRRFRHVTHRGGPTGTAHLVRIWFRWEVVFEFMTPIRMSDCDHDEGRAALLDVAERTASIHLACERESFSTLMVHFHGLLALSCLPIDRSACL